MTEAHPSPFLHHLRHLIGSVSAAAMTDGQLLERFLANRDETAVEVLVRRYGPLVFGVCRRVLHDAHTAEDAFQATFLVLMRKAPSLDRDKPLGSWLYTVAYRLALRARANELRRQRCEAQAAGSRPPTDGRTTRASDLIVALEEELQRLPEIYRAPLVLCYLEGKTNEQAAELLGCPRGSMAARLSQARERLRERLAQRGLSPSAGIATALATVAAQAAVPLPLLDNTVRAALWFAREEAGTADFVSAQAVALARRAFRAMLVKKLQVAGALLLAVAMLGTGVTMLLKAAPPAGPPAQETAGPPAPRTKRAEVPGAAPDRGGNAALAYRQALIALRRVPRRGVEKQFHEECLTMPLDADAREIVTRAAYALRMMQRGAARPRCDWRVGPERGIEAPHAHGDGAQVLSALACLRARLRFEEGRTAEAIEDVVAALTLARHITLDTTLDSFEAGHHIEHRTSEVLARALPKLDARALKNLKKRLDGLPPGGSVSTATMRMQEDLLNWIVGEVQEAPDKESLLAFLSQLCGGSGEAPEKRRAKGRAFLKECGGTAKGVLKYAAEMRSFGAPLAKKLGLPPDQLEKEWEREVRKRAGNPVFKLFAPVLHNIRRRQAQTDIRRALLSAALAVQLDGRDALKKHRDPVLGGPFDYVPFKGGFELRSKWKLDEKVRSTWKLDERFSKPAALTVGRRGK